MSAVAARHPLPAEAALLACHDGLVRRIAHHLAARLPASVDVDDLIQAGFIGLTQAARHFSASGGASFETFASIRIRGAMIDEIRQGDWAPRSVHRRARAAAEAIRSIEQATGREASATEVARALGLSAEEYARLSEDAARAPVLRLHEGGEGEHALLAAADPADEPLARVQHEAFRQAMAVAIGALPERERQVMALYYQDELNLKEIGAVLGVTESRVCQIHGQALLRLRSRLADWRGEVTDEH
jgi:RNA polymerase sigma factor for flagellar operon FliA